MSEDGVEGGAGRVAGLVHEFLGQDRMGAGADAVGVAWSVVDLDADEPVAELLPEPLEALAGGHRVAGEPQPEDADASVDPLLGHLEVPVGDAQVAAPPLPEGKRQRGLAEYRGDEAFVEHHPEGEAPGEAHADGADARPPAPAVLVGGEGAEPVGDRRGPSAQERRELPGHAGPGQARQEVPGGRLAAGRAEQRREDRRAADLGNGPPEVGDPRGDARNLGHDDDGRPFTGAQHGSGGAAVGELVDAVAGQFVDAHPTDATRREPGVRSRSGTLAG